MRSLSIVSIIGTGAVTVNPLNRWNKIPRDNKLVIYFLSFSVMVIILMMLRVADMKIHTGVKDYPQPVGCEPQVNQDTRSFTRAEAGEKLMVPANHHVLIMGHVSPINGHGHALINAVSYEREVTMPVVPVLPIFISSATCNNSEVEDFAEYLTNGRFGEEFNLYKLENGSTDYRTCKVMKEEPFPEAGVVLMQRMNHIIWQHDSENFQNLVYLAIKGAYIPGDSTLLYVSKENCTPLQASLLAAHLMESD